MYKFISLVFSVVLGDEWLNIERRAPKMRGAPGPPKCSPDDGCKPEPMGRTGEAPKGAPSIQGGEEVSLSTISTPLYGGELWLR